MIKDNFEFGTLMSKEYARMIIKVFREMDSVIKKERQVDVDLSLCSIGWGIPT